MNRLISQTLNRPEAEYLTDDAWRPIDGYLSGLPQRLALADKMRLIEATAVGATIEAMKTKYPTFQDHHLMAWEKGTRDVQLTLRYCVQAMVLDDVPSLVERLLIWLRTMLAGNKMTPRFIRDTYELLRDQCFKQLSPHECDLLGPALNATIDVLSNFPEPDVAAV